MKEYQINVNNSKNQIQKFIVEEYDNYVVLKQYLSNEIDLVEIPAKSIIRMSLLLEIVVFLTILKL